MVEIDGREDGDVGIHGVDGVEPPAQADLQNQQLAAGGSEDIKRRERAPLEVGERDLTAGGVDALEGAAQRVIVHVPPGHPHAFVVAQQVR